MRPARTAVTAAALAAILMLTGCGGASDPAGAPQQESQGGESDRLSISSITKENRGAACEAALGDYVAFGETFGIDASELKADSWEDRVDLYWNKDDPDKVATSINCHFEYFPSEHDELGSNESHDSGGINIILARSGEDGASIDGDDIRFNANGTHAGIEYFVEGDGVLVAAQINDPYPAVTPSFTGDDIETFLTEQALPKIEP